jgi:hypothetical protein
MNFLCHGCGNNCFGYCCNECILNNNIASCKMCNRYTININLKICEGCSPVIKQIQLKKCEKCNKKYKEFNKACPHTDYIIYSKPNFIVITSTPSDFWWKTTGVLTNICLTCFEKEHPEKYECFECKNKYFKYYQDRLYPNHELMKNYEIDEDTDKIICDKCNIKIIKKKNKLFKEKRVLTPSYLFVLDH